jgi:chaperonin GroES
MNIRPLHDRVIVKRVEEETTSAGGIIIPNAAKEKPSRGTIVAIGNGKVLENGDLRALEVKVGDQVLFGKYSGTEFKADGEEFLYMNESDIIGVIE